jgi:hypothetical protein
MNYGPLEFADFLRKHAKRDSAAVRAARAAKPQAAMPENQLRMISGPREPRVKAAIDPARPVSVYEAVAMNPPSHPRAPGAVQIEVRPLGQPIALVLSSHQPVEWRVSLASGVELAAVLLSGFGASSVVGVDAAVVQRIGGFYAFKRGSVEYRHLESEVMRCTGRAIARFESLYAGNEFTIE